MLKMVDGTGIIGVDMICPLGVSTPQPPNYDRVELEGAGMLVLPNSLDAPLERLELGGKTEQVQTSGAQLLNKDNFFVNPPTTFDKLKYYPLNIGDKECTLSTTCPASGNTSNLFLLAGNIDKGASSSVNGVSFGISRTVKIQDGYVTIALRTIGDNPNNPLDYDIMLNYGSEAKPYEPYTGGKPSPSPEYQQEIKNSGKWNEETQKFEVDVKITNAEQNWSKEQTLTITSDRPITKWDRLVEQGGQIGWLYGSVIAKIDETADISLYEPNGFYIHVKNIDKREKTGYCDKLYTKKMSNGEPFVLFGLANNNFLYTLNTQEFYGKTASEIKAKLKEYPLNIIGKSETTEFIPLPQSEQNAIRAVTTYYPTTVITADGGELDPDIKATYRKEI